MVIEIILFKKENKLSMDFSSMLKTSFKLLEVGKRVKEHNMQSLLMVVLVKVIEMHENCFKWSDCLVICSKMG